MIVDWKRHCEKIYATRELNIETPEDAKIISKQEIMYLRYLTYQKKFTKHQCFLDWYSLQNGQAAIMKDNLNWLEMKFDKLYRKIDKKTYQSMKYDQYLAPIVIFKEEVEYLNSLVVPLWVKQYWLTLLIYYKFQVQNTKNVQCGATVDSWCIRQTTYKDKRYGAACEEKIGRYHRENGGKIIKYQFVIGKVKKEYYTPLFLRDSGEQVFVADTLKDALGALSLLRENIRVCKTCGAEFEAGSKCKRFVCEDCYRKEQSRKRGERKKRSRAGAKTPYIQSEQGRDIEEQKSSNELI